MAMKTAGTHPVGRMGVEAVGQGRANAARSGKALSVEQLGGDWPRALWSGFESGGLGSVVSRRPRGPGQSCARKRARLVQVRART